ncbi:hypothetical protein K8R47_00040 [archaeon]|nr:hypothetical protein [archaeon]
METQDCLILWSYNTSGRSSEDISLDSGRLHEYVKAGKPVFEVPTMGSDPSIFYRENGRNPGVNMTLVSKDMGIEDSRYQFRFLRNVLDLVCLESAEIIGMPGCVDFVASELNKRGIKAKAIN